MTGEAWVVELEIARKRTPRPAANLVLAAPDLLSGTSPFTQSPPSVAEPPPPSAPPRLIFAVTAHHEHYGSVSVYAQDVSFCSFAWPKGEACGTKTTAITQVLRCPPHTLPHATDIRTPALAHASPPPPTPMDARPSRPLTGNAYGGHLLPDAAAHVAA